MAYIREHYGVPARRGGKIRFDCDCDATPESKVATIVGSRGQYLRVRFDQCPNPIVTLHPTWQIDYLDAEKADA